MGVQHVTFCTVWGQGTKPLPFATRLFNGKICSLITVWDLVTEESPGSLLIHHLILPRVPPGGTRKSGLSADWRPGSQYCIEGEKSPCLVRININKHGLSKIKRPVDVSQL
jgi:hypothetical protein